MSRCSLFLVMLLSLRGLYSFGQPDSLRAQADTSSSFFFEKVQEAGKRDRQRSLSTFEEGRNARKQRAVCDQLSKMAQEVKLYLESGPDLKALSGKLGAVQASYNIARDGVLEHKGSGQTERNLSVSSAILYQLISETEAQKTQTDRYTADLVRYRTGIDSLLSDPAIYLFPKDSIALVRYLSRLRVIVNQGNPADNALNATLVSVQDLQNRTDLLLFELKVAYEQVESYRKRLSVLTFMREFPDIWEPSGFDRPFADILRFSVAKERMALAFYIRENRGRVLLLVLLAVSGMFAIRALKKKMEEEEGADSANGRRLLLRYPLAASLVILPSIGQFIFINAPFIFNACLWMVAVVSLFLLLRGFITAFWLRFWVMLSVLFLLACGCNFMLQASRPERWAMVLLCVVNIAYGCFILTSRHCDELRERSILLFLRFFVVAEALSLLLNLLGRYNLSKALLVAGNAGVTTAILFIWVVRLVNEGLSVGAAVYRQPERRLFYLNFNRLGTRAPALLYVLLVVGWIIVVGRNFYAFKRIAVPFHDFLQRPRSLGDYTFSINGLFLFLLIACCSLALSRIISFFTADPQATHSGSPGRRVSSGSWILLLRIFIISIGLFLAFAASGLPLDRLTIVLGALSVGIGLGLQGLVSSLVSGLIIAFERPVNVGDLIELNGRSGTMKSIGFRSSVILLSDGSSLVIPNGDLLSGHVINWSLTKVNRRIVVPVPVAYGSDLEQVKQLLEAIAAADGQVLKAPAPAATARSFGENAIGFELVCWVRHPMDAADVSGRCIAAIDKAFRQAGIAIPLPQRDVHLHRSDDGQAPPQ